MSARRNMPRPSPKPAALRLPPGFYGFVLMSMVEKTKPICDGKNGRKVLFERILWRNTVRRNQRKQSQTKPIRQASRCRCGIAGRIKANFELPYCPKEREKEKNRSVHLIIKRMDHNAYLIY